jgi:DNA-3-methyladenine glycosylase I
MSECCWGKVSDFMERYHNEEWGVPLHDDYKHFEFLVLDAFQAGLSWEIVLKKRDNFRKAFDDFNFTKIAKYDDQKVEQLLNDAGIIRNRLKIAATITNAKCFLDVIKEFGSFDAYIWQFVNGKPINSHLKSFDNMQPKTKESDAMSKALLKRGFKFVGSTICYSYMQAAGMVNDHLMTCRRWREVK